MKTNFKPELVFRNAVTEGVRYIKENPGVKALVLGISGGVDSALTAALAREVANKAGVVLYGRVLPMSGNKTDEIQRAERIAELFCDDFATIDLTQVKDAMINVAFEGQQMPTDDLNVLIRLGNIKARTRMLYLYDLARRVNGMVLSTDNYTELLLGFWTLHGDVGDFGFIQELWKTEVFWLTEYIATEICDVKAQSEALLACVDAKPTDGLGVTDSDIDQILPEWKPTDGSYRDAYRRVDEILSGYRQGFGEYNETHPVIQRHLATKFKRENPVNLKRAILFWNYNTEI